MDLKTQDKVNLFDAVLEASSNAILINRISDGAVQYCNEAASKILGYPQEKLLGKRAIDFYVNIEERLDLLKQIQSRGVVKDFEVKLKRGDGKHIWVLINVKVVEISHEANVIVEITDVSKYRETEELLRESEAQFRGLLEYSIQGVYIHRNWQILTANDSMARIMGFGSKKEFIETARVEEMIDPEDLARLKDYREKRERGEEAPKQHIARYIKKDGSRVWLESFNNVVPWKNGPAIQTTIIDITDRIRAEEALASQQKMMQDLLENTQEGFWQIDNDAVTVNINPAMCTILGRPAEEIIGRPIFDFVDEENLAIFRQEIKTRKQGTQAAYEVSVLNKNGANIPCINNATPIYDNNRNKIGSVGFFTEITEIRKAREEAEKANSAKSDFLSSMSHELRTPLNSILGFAQILEHNPDEPLSPNQQLYVGHIYRGGEHLLELINEILDLSKIESGQVELELEATPIDHLVQESILFVSSMAKDRGIKVSVMNDSEKNLEIFVDRARLKQALLNLLSNAVKYNRENGQILLDYRKVGPAFPSVTPAWEFRRKPWTICFSRSIGYGRKNQMWKGRELASPSPKTWLI